MEWIRTISVAVSDRQVQVKMFRRRILFMLSRGGIGKIFSFKNEQWLIRFFDVELKIGVLTFLEA